MRHRNHKFKLNKPTGARKALLKNLARALIYHERILTTSARAKALKMFIEPIITLAKNYSDETKDQGMHARRQVFAKLQDKFAVTKLFDEIGKRYQQREKNLEAENKFGKGGYTRTILAGPRAGDGADMAYIELVERVEKEIKKPKKEKTPTLRPQV